MFIGGAYSSGVEHNEVASLLSSAQFSLSKQAAPGIAGDAGLIRALLADVEHKQVEGWKPTPQDARLVALDIACAVLEARMEELEDGTVDAEAETVSAARLHLLVAVLHFYVMSALAQPDAGHPDRLQDAVLAAHLSALALIGWAVKVVREELPVMD